MSATRRPPAEKRKNACEPQSLEELVDKACDATAFLKALSHEVRLIILCLLFEGEKSVSEFEEILNLRQPAISQQLIRLKADNLVEARRDGKNIYYSIGRPEVREIVAALHHAFCGR